jgi:hypothetical protein
MIYSKPEITLLGNAARVIESLGKPYGSMVDGSFDNDHPAYDLDE